MTSPPRDGQAGLTLIEMLVALAIFALVGLAGFVVIDTIIRARDRTEGRLEAYASVDRALYLMARDLEQSNPGSLTLEGAVLSFRRNVGANELRLRYEEQEGALLRQSSGRAGVTLDQRVAGDVVSATYRFLDGQRQWQDTWPTADGSPNLLAVELRLQLQLGVGEPVTVLRLAEMPAMVPE